MDKKAILQTLYKLADNTWKDIVKCEQVLTRAQTTLDIQTQLCADAQALLAQSTNADERNVLVFNLAMHIQDKYNTNTFINQTKTAIADMEQDINNLNEAAKIIKEQQEQERAFERMQQTKQVRAKSTKRQR